MKKIAYLPFLFVAFIIFNVQAYHNLPETEILFLEIETNKQWEEILRKAKKENKLIFMDVYADWCSFCIKMDRQVYTDNDVAVIYNSSFINVKLDAEKADGPLIAKYYNVDSYPTLLYIDGDGKLINSKSGFTEAKEFTDLGKISNKISKELPIYKKKFVDNIITDSEIIEYASILKASNQILEAENVANKYLLKLKKESLSSCDEILNYKNWNLIKDYVVSLDNPFIDYLIKYKQILIDDKGTEDVKSFFEEIYYFNAEISAKNKDERKLEQVITKILPNCCENSELDYLTITTKLYYFKANDEWKKYSENVESYIARTSPEYDFLYEQAKTIYTLDNISDTEIINKAANWANKAVALDENFYSLIVYAGLLNMNKKTTDALAIAKKALEISESDEEHQYAQKLIDTITTKENK